MSIYKDTQKPFNEISQENVSVYYYVYRITNLLLNKHYYGSRTSRKRTPKDDLGHRYFSSSQDKAFVKDQKRNPSHYKYKVVCVCESIKQALELEIKLHERFDVAINPNFYNKSKQTSTGFNVTGMSVYKDKNENVILVRTDDPKIQNGELVHVNKGMISVKDSEGNFYRVPVDDERFISGELVHYNKGKAAFNDEKGNTIQIRTDDPRVISGDLISTRIGKTIYKDNNGNTMLARTDDPRVVCGDLIGVNTGKGVYRDKDGNRFCVRTDDPRVISGELVHANKGIGEYRDKDGNRFRVRTDDPRVISGELKHFNEKKSTYKDKDGNIFFVTIDDPRVISGELVHANKGRKVIHNPITKECKRISKKDPIPDGWMKGFLPRKPSNNNNLQDYF